MKPDNSTVLALFRQWAGVDCELCSELGANGSNRKYLRLSASGKSCIAAINDDLRENEAFLYFSREMKSRGISVPQIYAVSGDHRCYLQQDLGDTTLYSYLYAKRQSGVGFDGESIELYKQVLSDLVDIQTRCRDVNFNHAYPRSDFDRQAIQWDFNYFKYFFLKLLYVPFDEQLLENDFQVLIDYLLAGDCSAFMYRDFQTRNIMVVSGQLSVSGCRSHVSDHGLQLYYIDYQGARRGAPQYDAASLLYSSKAEIPEAIRQELLKHYVDCYYRQAVSGQSLCTSHKSQVTRESFTQRFYAYVLARIMQAMGAYGYRGLYERKDYFINSIPLAVSNLRTVVEKLPQELNIPHLREVFNAIVNSQLAVSGQQFATLQPFNPSHSTIPSDELTVTVGSFSYKKGLPTDPSGNGGGFIFDCRALPNPGRYPEYRNVTGKDPSVIAFLQKEEAVSHFIDHACALVSQSVKKYTERKFSSLQVFFGCTGGQHRSVYCAEQMASFLRKNFDCHVVLKHREQS
ncbi:MAG: phosphotransferase [Bacteroidales bacterium]|nr:phosphotransferase [Bacteroidales bacterium]